MMEDKAISDDVGSMNHPKCMLNHHHSIRQIENHYISNTRKLMKGTRRRLTSRKISIGTLWNQTQSYIFYFIGQNSIVPLLHHIDILYPMTSVEISEERGCWEMCDFSTPRDPHSYGSWDKSKTHTH